VTGATHSVQGGCPDTHCKHLSILYFNARSLYPKLDELRVLCTLQTPDIICIAETWLCGDIENSECHLPGYNCIRCDRDRHGGGVALFISDKLGYEVTMSGPDGLEFLLVSVHGVNNNHNKVYVGIWYRPPANSAAIDTLYSVLEI